MRRIESPCRMRRSEKRHERAGAFRARDINLSSQLSTSVVLTEYPHEFLESRCLAAYFQVG
jgi:hypothetical protein